MQSFGPPKLSLYPSQLLSLLIMVHNGGRRRVRTPALDMRNMRINAGAGNVGKTFMKIQLQ